jgi:surface-adhesin protein E
MTRARVSRYAVVSFLLVAAVNGCGVARAIPSSAPPEKRVPGWVEIARTATTTAYLDTARLERQTNGIVDAWFRLVYSPPIKPDFFPPVDYEAAESRQQVDCAKDRTRDVEMRMQPVGGKPGPAKVPDRDWQPIATHRIGADLFRILCRSIDGLRPR